MSKTTVRQQHTSLNLGVIYPYAAGLDVGSTTMMLSYPGESGVQTVREYDAYSEDLYQMAEDLQQAGVTHVGMEATGVYWMAVYEILEQKGFKVTLVNARHYKNVDGQKTDVKDCQWLQQLHAHGLLRSSHIASEQFRELRTYIHERGVFQENKSQTLNRIHKVLTQMNIKFQHEISDIEGVEGMKVLRKIAAGEQNVEVILQCINMKRLKKSTPESLRKSLEGLFKPHYITVLQKHLIAYDFYKEQMLGYEKLIEKVLQQLIAEHGNDANSIETKTTKARKNEYHFNVGGYLSKLVSVDVAAIDGFDEITALKIIAVVGLDMNKWPTAEHFCSWLNLSPRPKISGGKIIGYQKRFTNNAATQAFRVAAQTMWQHKGSLGHLYRRLSATKGTKKAIKAVARKLAVIFYNMIKYKTNYDPTKVSVDEEKLKNRKLSRLRKEAQKMGYQIDLIKA